jgi:hypothetical protein
MRRGRSVLRGKLLVLQNVLYIEVGMYTLQGIQMPCLDDLFPDVKCRNEDRGGYAPTSWHRSGTVEQWFDT